MALPPSIKDKENQKFEEDTQDGGVNVRVSVKEIALDGDTTTIPVDIQGQPISVDDNGGSLTVDGTVAVSNLLPDGHNVTVDNAAGASAVNIQDGGNSITVDGSVTIADEDITIDQDNTSGSVTNGRHTITFTDCKMIRIYMDHGDTDKIYWNLSASGAVTADNGTLLTRWKDVTFEAGPGELISIVVAVSAATAGPSRVRWQILGRNGTSPSGVFA